MKSLKKFLFIITLIYFALGFVNILFAWLGLICMALPLFFLFKDNRKTWCQGMCPRSCLFTQCGRLTKNYSYKTPIYFVKGNFKWIMLGYFAVSMAVIIFTTIMVGIGKIQPAYQLRFLLVIPIPLVLPQMITFDGVALWLYQFAYSMYSMMMTTSVLGLIMALVFKPRT